MKSSNLLNALQKVKDNRLEPFIAPLPEGTVELISVQNSIPYWFLIENHKPGWSWLTPTEVKHKGYNLISTRGGVEPYPHQIEDYLNQLPHFNVIALYPVSQGSWLCVPHSVGDTKQRGWDGKPKVFTLCNENIEPLDVVRVANLAGTLIYHEVSKLTLEAFAAKDVLNEGIVLNLGRDWKVALFLLKERIDQLKKAQKKDDLESQIKHHLEFVGSSLQSWTENVDGTLQITFTDPYDGKPYTLPKVDKNLRTQVAGLCLSGTDRQHNLSSIVEVIHEARKLRRFDLDQSYYL